MNDQFKIETAQSSEKQMADRNRIAGWWSRAALVGTAFSAGVAVLVYSALADAPVLTIAPLGSNQFNIVITNGVTTTNYTLFWTPVLGDSLNYPWQVLGMGSVGQTNFNIDGGEWQFGFFRVLLGADQDGDGIPEWQDAQPLNPSVGILSITIDSPLNGTSLN
jgi:hypothetical protein